MRWMLLGLPLLLTACAPCDPCPGGEMRTTAYCGKPGQMHVCGSGQSPDLTTFWCNCGNAALLSGIESSSPAACAAQLAGWTRALRDSGASCR